MWERLKTLIQTNVLWIHLSPSTLSFPLRFSVYIWTSGSWTSVWVLFVCWCTLSSCVSPSSSSLTYSPSSICPPAVRNETVPLPSPPSLTLWGQWHKSSIRGRPALLLKECLFIDLADPLSILSFSFQRVQYWRSLRICGVTREERDVCDEWSYWLIYRLFKRDRDVVNDDYCLVWCEYFFIKLFCILHI